jgi:hypothetical protein
MNAAKNFCKSPQLLLLLLLAIRPLADAEVLLLLQPLGADTTQSSSTPRRGNDSHRVLLPKGCHAQLSCVIQI